ARARSHHLGSRQPCGSDLGRERLSRASALPPPRDAAALWERPWSRTAFARQRAPTTSGCGSPVGATLVANGFRARARSHLGSRRPCGSDLGRERLSRASALPPPRVAAALWERPWSRTAFARKRAPTTSGRGSPV